VYESEKKYPNVMVYGLLSPRRSLKCFGFMSHC